MSLREKLRDEAAPVEIQAEPKRRITGKKPATAVQETEKKVPEVKGSDVTVAEKDPDVTVPEKKDVEEKDPDETEQPSEALPAEIQEKVTETDPKKLLTRAKGSASPALTVLKDREQIPRAGHPPEVGSGAGADPKDPAGP